MITKQNIHRGHFFSGHFFRTIVFGVYVFYLFICLFVFFFYPHISMLYAVPRFTDSVVSTYGLAYGFSKFLKMFSILVKVRLEAVNLWIRHFTAVGAVEAHPEHLRGHWTVEKIARMEGKTTGEIKIQTLR